MKKRKAAYIQITRKCNNECVFCSNPQFEKEISLAEAKKSIDALCAEGVTEMFLTGGEPTTSPHLFEIIRYLRERQVTPRMITNGVELSNMALAKRIYAAGIRSINLSFHSHLENTADLLSGKPGHFQKQLMGIHNALRVGFDININTTINAENYDHLPELVTFIAKAFPHIGHFVFNFLDPGMADGNLHSRAHDNPWVVAKFPLVRPFLANMVKRLKKYHKTFRIERVPLCCMKGFEEYSTETRKIVKEELYMCSFIEKESVNKIRVVNPYQGRIKLPCCEKCILDMICAGIQKEYLSIHDAKGLVPVRVGSLKRIVNVIRKS
jgi:MoaA/NifB/PqqE/SkfB family radical SAM enzyme